MSGGFDRVVDAQCIANEVETLIDLLSRDLPDDERATLQARLDELDAFLATV